MLNFWNKLSDKKPICYKKGHWDGKVSDRILINDSEGYVYLGTCYEGEDESGYFCVFYDDDEWEIENVTHWAYIPEIKY